MTEDKVTYFKCSCNASARFRPLYRFQESGKRPAIAMGALCPASMECANCHQMYVWVQADAEHDGGWTRQSPLDDLIALEAAGG